jgi:hypothetical protein
LIDCARARGVVGVRALAGGGGGGGRVVVVVVVVVGRVEWLVLCV